MQLATMLGAPDAVFQLPADEWHAGVTAVLREAFTYHFEQNAFFRAQCDAAGVTPADIAVRADLARVPLLPVSMFKRPDAHVLLSVPLTDVELEIRSTGTGGVRSVARRDATTVTRVACAVVAIYREFLAVSHGAALFLSPSTAETPDLGMKVFNVLNAMFDDHLYAVRNYTFDPAEALAYLRRWDGRMTRHIVGPPFMVNGLLRFLELEARPVTLDPGSLVITLGGWQHFTGESIARDEFDSRVERLLGVPRPRIRDTYGMIESNLLAVECEHQRKHVPPWCHVSIRDVTDTAVELPPGAPGAIAILDALNTSYPGFLLSDDVGAVDETPCPCGRSGQTLSFHRRMHADELGCGAAE